MKQFFRIVFITLLILVSLSLEGLAQITKTIGYGTTTLYAYGPVNIRSGTTHHFKYHKSAYLYTAKELNIPKGAYITKIEWYKNTIDTISASGNAYLDLYLKNSSTQNYAIQTWSNLVSGSTKVLSDSLSNKRNSPKRAWWAFDVKPFLYRGQSLEILCESDMSRWSLPYTQTSFGWSSTSLSPNIRTLYNYDSISPTNLRLRSSYRPNIKITYTYTPRHNNAGIDSVLSLKGVSCLGSHDIEVSLHNNGLDTLKKVDIHWEFNKLSQSTINWTGSLAPDSSIKVKLGSVNLNKELNNHLFVYSKNPNGFKDSVSFNDSLIHEFSAGMKGSYTVGKGSSFDYQNLIDAVEDMKTRGICDDINLQLEKDTFLGHINLEGIKYQKKGIKIRILGDTTSTNKPILKSNDISFRYLMQIIGVSNLELAGLHFDHSTGNGNIIAFYDYCNNVKIKHCSLSGINPTTGAISTAISVRNGSDNFQIYNNHIANVISGILFQSDTRKSYGHQISKNTIDSFLSYGIYLARCDSASVTENQLLSTDNGTKPNGIYAIADSFVHIERNKIQISGSTNPKGIYMFNCYGDVNNQCVLSNNLVNMTSTVSTAEAYGIDLYLCNYVFSAYNTAVVKSYNQNSSAIKYVSYKTDSFWNYNNIACNLGSGRAIYVSNGPAIIESDNNIYYATGRYFANWSKSISSFKDLQIESGKDVNSDSINPLFYSKTDLRTFAAGIDGKAKALAQFNTDVNNKTRHKTEPDIGAYEFDLLRNDAGLKYFAGPRINLCSGTEQVKVNLSNRAVDTLKKVTINWRINGVDQKPFNWSGNLKQGDQLDVAIGSFTVDTNKTYLIECYTESPNGFKDSFNSNDSISQSFYSGVKGLFTVGKDNKSDFESLSDAIDMLVKQGVCDSVDIQVKSGVYEEQVLIPNVPGMASTATITIAGHPSNKTKPIITYEAMSAENDYVLRLSRTGYLTIDGLEIRSKSDVYGTAIDLTGNLNHNLTISNCEIHSNFNPASGKTNSGIKSDNSRLSVAKFLNNHIVGGNYGIYFNHYGGNSYNIVINNNSIDSFLWRGISVVSTRVLSIQNNRIQDNPNSSSTYGVYLYEGELVTLHSNYIQILGDGYAKGVFLKGTDTDKKDLTSIKNNMIIMSNDQTDKALIGLDIDRTPYNVVANNSILIKGGDPFSTAIYIDQPGSFSQWFNTYIYNNVFVNDAQGYALYTSNSSNSNSIFGSDNNVYFTNGEYIAYWYGKHKDVASLRNAEGYDGKSLVRRPIFYGDTDLHSFSYFLGNKSGSYMPGDDFDGESRSKSKTLGADEFDRPINDAGFSLNMDTNQVWCKGNNAISLLLTNEGLDTLKSVTIEWKLNGVSQKSYDWKGVLSPDSIGIANIGNINITPGSKYFLEFEIKKPNQVEDSITQNNHFELRILGGLSGDFEIGGTGTPDYKTINDAVNDLKTKGLCGDVNLLIHSGEYDESILLSHLPGLGVNAKLKLTKHPKDTTLPQLVNKTDFINRYVLRIDTCSYITIDSLHIASFSNQYVYGIQMEGPNKYINITNCTITGASGSTNYNRTLINVKGVNFHTIQILNNKLNKGSTAISLGGDLKYPGKNIRVENNVIEEFDGRGIHCYANEDVQIVNNIVDSRGSFTSSTGIFVREGGRILIDKNKVNIRNRKGDGIYMDLTDSEKDEPSIVRNNMVLMSNKSTSYAVRGMYFYYNEGLEILNNSCLLLGGKSTTSTNYYLNANNWDYTKFYNNIGYNKAKGYAFYSSKTLQIDACDYNCFFTNGSYLAYWNGNVSTLSALKSASKKNRYTLNIDPLFISDTDLHSVQKGLDGKGYRTLNVTEDIDGEPRSLKTPDIGADEFSVVNDDIAVIEIIDNLKNIAVDKQEIKVVLYNFGRISQSNFPVEIRLTGANTFSKTMYYTSTLASKQKDTFSLGYYRLFKAGRQHIKAYTRLNNDEATSNDTAYLNDKIINLLTTIPEVDDVSICKNDTGIQVLKAKGDFTSYQWFKSDTSSLVLSETDELKINVNKSDSFYVRGYNRFRDQLGLKDYQGTGGHWSEMTNGLVFDVNSNITIDSITIDAYSSGNLVINIDDAEDDRVYTKQFTVKSGKNRIPLNIKLPIAKGYKIYPLGSNVLGLYRSTSGAKLPYSDANGNVVLQKNISGGSSSLFYFYDWAISLKDSCYSERKKVKVNILTYPAPKLSDITICEGETATFDLTPVANQVKWFNSQSDTQVISNDLKWSSPKLKQTSSFYFTDTRADGCETERGAVSAIVNKAPESGIVIENQGKRLLIKAKENISGYIHSWEVEDSTYGDVSQVYHDFETNGIKIIIHHVENKSTGCKSSDTLNYDLKTVGVLMLSSGDWLIKPNPSHGSFEILSSNNQNIESLDIFDNTGSKIYSINDVLKPTIKLDLDYPKGLYFIYLKSDSGVVVFKHIIH